MGNTNIIFADLSTYTPKETIAFYESVFDWKYYEDNGYYLAYKGNNAVTGLYETPDKFKQMQMPHFWMTYIQVDDINRTVEKAKALGGIIEMRDDNNSIGSVALIRDTQGAGFTVYQGEKLQNTRTKNEINTLIWNELHVSAIDIVIPFYSEIFDWTFNEDKKDHYQIFNDQNEHIADALQIPNEYKGKYEYWVCTFGVNDLKVTSNKIINNGGSIVMDEGKRILFTDNSGQAFFYIAEMLN